MAPINTLVLNGGSSSWKSALFRGLAPDAVPQETAMLQSEASVSLAWESPAEPARLEARERTGRTFSRFVRVQRGAAAVPVLLDAYRELGCDPATFDAVGHRIVHGGERFSKSVCIDDAVLAGLRELAPFAPSHNPVELAGIGAIARLLPAAAQVASFDTAFHRSLPAHAYVYGGPDEWLARGIRRYGFHGINVAYCIERVGRMPGSNSNDMRCVVAHLGGGCSVTAVRAGASVDTSMGFTPLDGIVMGTRSGSVDPGIIMYLLRDAPAQSAGDAAARIEDTLNHASGLLGVSGVSSDVRNVSAAAADGNARAKLALDVFTYRIAASVAAFMPALERIDALVFTGGIGEHAAAIRAAVCDRLAFAGVTLEASKNQAGSSEGDADMAAGDSRVHVFVVAAREEWFVARECARVSSNA